MIAMREKVCMYMCGDTCNESCLKVEITSSDPVPARIACINSQRNNGEAKKNMNVSR